LIIYSIVKSILWVFFKAVFFVRCEGKENIPKTGGVIVSANHQSNFDPPIVGSFLTRSLKFMAKKELFKSKIGNWFLTTIGAFPVDRGGSDIGVLKTSIKLLKEENAICIFPEGTRKCKDINQVKSGAVMFAIKAQVPILPVGIAGGYKPFKPMKIVFGKPVYYTEYYDKKVTQEELHELSVQLMKDIYALADVNK